MNKALLKSGNVLIYRSATQRICFAFVFGFASVTVVAQPTVLVDACKGLKDPKKRSACLEALEGTARPAAPGKVADTVKTPLPDTRTNSGLCSKTLC
jgi:hypothetical protein